MNALYNLVLIKYKVDFEVADFLYSLDLLWVTWVGGWMNVNTVLWVANIEHQLF